MRNEYFLENKKRHRKIVPNHESAYLQVWISNIFYSFCPGVWFILWLFEYSYQVRWLKTPNFGYNLESYFDAGHSQKNEISSTQFTAGSPAVLDDMWWCISRSYSKFSYSEKDLYFALRNSISRFYLRNAYKSHLLAWDAGCGWDLTGRGSRSSVLHEISISSLGYREKRNITSGLSTRRCLLHENDVSRVVRAM